MDLFQAIGGDGAILLFSAAGLAATAIAIFVDTRSQASEPVGESIRLD